MLSRRVPGTETPPSPVDWSETRLYQVTPRFRPKHLGLYPAWIGWPRTMKRTPSAEATSPEPQSRTIGRASWLATSLALAARRVSLRMKF